VALVRASGLGTLLGLVAMAAMLSAEAGVVSIGVAGIISVVLRGCPHFRPPLCSPAVQEDPQADIGRQAG